MKTRSQTDAIGAWNKVKTRQEKQFRADAKAKDKYGSMAHHLPVLIQTCGLIQALAFVQARGQDPHQWLLDDLAGVMNYDSGTNLVNQARQAELMEYIYLSTRATEVLLWFKRYAQSELDVDASTETNLEGENE